jgi:hypothetical protein
MGISVAACTTRRSAEVAEVVGFECTTRRYVHRVVAGGGGRDVVVVAQSFLTGRGVDQTRHV